MPIDRLFHRPTIEKWLREFHETMGSMKKNEDASARRSVLWMVFAMAKEHQSPEPITMSDDRSITLGRPRIFHDDDIDQDFLSGVDDDEFFT
ncbi:hypothetical protein ACEPPN_010975 [Leptodophora sp. 'Broadleaf-Isolate-01']